MGGNALKNCETERKSRDEYFDLLDEVVMKLFSLFPHSRFRPIQAYFNKPSFGDMDILCTKMPSGVDYENTFATLFNSKEIVHNGNCWSLEYKNFQVDLIFTAEEDMLTSEIYFAYNDLGNFIGRIAHKMGFKYGHEGLVYQFRSMDDHIFDSYVVSKDPEMIFAFLGYDILEFEKGFAEMEDVFKFAASTPYFHKDIFLFHNRNNKSRVRDEKRKNYNAFLKWLETAEGLPEYQWHTFEEKGGRKDVEWCLQRAFEFFPEFKTWYLDAKFRLSQRNRAKELLNGKIVSDMTGLKNEELGKFMQYLNRCIELDMQYLVSYSSKDAFIVTEFNSLYHKEAYIMDCLDHFQQNQQFTK